MQPINTNRNLARAFSIGSAIALALALAGRAYFYQSTYAQPDFGYAFGVMLTVGSVMLLSLSGLFFAIGAIRLSKSASPLLWLLCAAHLALCIGVPLVFKLRYVPNQPLHRTTAARCGFGMADCSDVGFAAGARFRRWSVSSFDDGWTALA